MFSEREQFIDLKECSSVAELVGNVNADTSLSLEFPNRISLTSKEGILGQDDPLGRFVKVKAEGKTYIIPLGNTAIDDVSGLDSGLGAAYECQGYEPYREQKFNNWQLIEPAEF